MNMTATAQRKIRVVVVDDSVNISIAAGRGGRASGRRWDLEAPGLRLAHDISHDFGIIFEIVPPGAGFDCRIELARARNE